RPSDEGDAHVRTDYPLPAYVYWGGPQGFAVERRTELPAFGARDVKVADLDGDGFLDIVLACRAGAASLVYWGGTGAHGAYAPARRLALPTRRASRCAIADLDNDGRPDLVFANEHDGRSHATQSVVYWNRKTGFSATDRTELPTLGALDVGASDLDGDG